MQCKFRNEIIKRYETCIITNMDELFCEAAHIIPFSESENFDIENGILLNCILHKLFDKYMFSINPDTLCVEVSNINLKYNILKNINNKKIIKLKSHYKTIENLKKHYNEYIKKLNEK